MKKVKAWKCDVISLTVQICFAKASFKTDTELDVSDSDICLSDEIEKLQQLKDMGHLEKKYRTV